MRAKIRRAVKAFDKAITAWFIAHGFGNHPGYGENAYWDSGARSYAWAFQRVRKDIENVIIDYLPRHDGIGTQLSIIPKTLEVPDAWKSEISTAYELPVTAVRERLAWLEHKKRWWELFSPDGHGLRLDEDKFDEDLRLYLKDLEKIEQFFSGDISSRQFRMSPELYQRLKGS